MSKRTKAFIQGYGRALDITGGINSKPKLGYDQAVKSACKLSQKTGQRLSKTFWKTLKEFEEH